MLDSFLGVTSCIFCSSRCSRLLQCSRTCWCSLLRGAPQNSSAKECPHWSTFSKHTATVSTGDPNRATIQRHGTGSLSSHRTTLQCSLSVRPRKDGCSAPWKNTSHVPVCAKPDVSFCYIKIKFTDKKANVRGDKRGSSQEDALSSGMEILGICTGQCQGHL